MEWKWWPSREGWIGEEDTAFSSDEEQPLNLEDSLSSTQFKMAQDKEEEFVWS